MTRFASLAVAILLGISSVTNAARAVETIRLTVASGYPPVIAAIRVLKSTFIPTVDRGLAQDGRYKIDWNEAYAGTLVKPTGTLAAVEQGITDIGHVVTLFYGAQLPYQNVGYYAPFGTDDPKLASDVMQALHDDMPVVREAWSKQNQVYLGNYPLDSYQLFTKFPVTSINDLKGRKIGGGGANLNWLKGTGAAGVPTTGARAYNDLNTGVIDGVLAPATLGKTARLYEVAPYLTLVNFGAVSVGAITVNKDRWDGLPAVVREALTHAGSAYREAMIAEVRKETQTAIEAMVKAGAKVSTLDRRERARWAAVMPNPAAAWAVSDRHKAVLKRYMDALRQAGTVFPRQWDKEL